MSKSSTPLALIFGLGAGALLALSAAKQPDALGALGRRRGDLETADPLPAVEVALGPGLAALGGRLRETASQVPDAIRRDLGFGPTGLSFREDLDLSPDAYAIRLRGLTVATGGVVPDRLLAVKLSGRGEAVDLPGEPTQEPVMNRPAAWIGAEDAGQAALLGYDVIEPGLALALHLDAILRRHLHELLTREETYRLLDRARALAPRTVAELAERLEAGRIQRVLQALLREQVSLRDLALVIERLADAAAVGTDPAVLTETVRRGLARQLSASVADGAVLHVIALGSRWDALATAAPGDPVAAETVRALRKAVNDARDRGHRPVLVAPDGRRAAMRQLIEGELPDLPVLAEPEVAPGYRLEPVADLGGAVARS